MKKILYVALGILALCVIVVILWIVVVLSGLPDVSVLRHYRPAAATEVLDKDGMVLTQYYDRTFRIWTPISSLPDVVIQAVVIAEDDTFFEHRGVNYKATWDALVHDVRRRRFARGGSTITQQMIKNVLLSREKTISRKVREYVLAGKAEQLLTKRRILEIYLNEVEWGPNISGIEAASRFYLGKNASGLNASEAALLAGMLPNPRYFNPYKRLDKARERQQRVLFNMQQAKIITQDEYAAALSAPLRLREENSSDENQTFSRSKKKPCYQRALEQVLVSVFGDVYLYRSGNTIKTTLDMRLQEELERGESFLIDKADETHGPFIVVKQGGKIRALVCSPGREQEIRDTFDSPGFFYPGYEVSVVSPPSISREQIILSVDSKSK